MSSPFNSCRYFCLLVVNLIFFLPGIEMALGMPPRLKPGKILTDISKTHLPSTQNQSEGLTKENREQLVPIYHFPNEEAAKADEESLMQHSSTIPTSSEREELGLARIFHPSLLRKPGRPMDTALDLNLDSDSMDTYSHRPSSAPALSHQPSQLPRHESDEISGLDQEVDKHIDGLIRVQTPLEERDDDNNSLSESPVQKPSRLSIDSRRLSTLFKQEEVQDANQKHLKNTAGIAMTVLKAAKKFKQGLTSYRSSTPLHIASQITEFQRSQIRTQSATIEAETKREQASLQQIFLKRQQVIIRQRAVLNFARGIPSFLHQPEIALSIIKEDYARQQWLTQLSQQLNFYHLQNELCTSYLSKRQAILPDIEESTDNFKILNAKTTEALRLIQQTGTILIQQLVPDFQRTKAHLNLEKLNQEQIEYLQQTISLLREMQYFVLGCHTSLYITESKSTLDRIEAYLDTDTLVKKKPISQTVRNQYHEHRKFMSASKALFSLKETISTTATIEAAQEIATAIQDRLAEIEAFQTALKEATKLADDKDVLMLTAETTLMEQLQSCFQDAMLAYREIQDEATIEDVCGSLHELKKAIEDHSCALLKKADQLAMSTTASPLFNELTELLNTDVFQLDNIHSLPQHPSVFLNHLENLDDSLGTQCIIGTHGKIALDSLPEKTDGAYPIEVKREWVAGTNAIREALRRGWGIHIVQQFDKEHEPFMRMSVPLQVSVVRRFLLDKDGHQKYARSFFIPLEMKHQDFLKHLEDLREVLDQTSKFFNSVIAHKVIKIDADTLAFNSFAKKLLSPSQETVAAADLRQRQAGFNYIRKALESAFPEASLSTKQLEEVLKKFDVQFKLEHSINEKPALTFITAIQFMSTQKEILKKRNYWEKNIAPYLNRDALIASALNGLSYTVGSHLGTIMLFTLPYLYILWLNHTSHMLSSST